MATPGTSRRRRAARLASVQITATTPTPIPLPARGRGSFWLAAVAFAALGFTAATAEPAIVDAARDGDAAAVAALIEEGVNVNAGEANGTTALHYAVYRDDAAMVQQLIAAGSDPSAVNLFGSTPLSEAAVIGDATVIAMLLDAGAQADAPNTDGQTALMVAARGGELDAVKLLISRGANVNAVEAWGGQTALMWAASQCQTDVVRELLAHGADPNLRGTAREWTRRIHSEPRPKDMHRGGFTALHYAARQGCADAAQALAQGGADLDLTDPDRTTPLVVALMNLHFDTAITLIEAGADLDKWDLYGQSPVYAAVDVNTVPDGGRPDIPSLDETTALDVLQVLLERGANPNLQLKLRPPYRNVIFDRGGDQVLSFGATPLLRAAKAGDNDAIRLLLAHGALADLPNETGVTPLMAAAGMGHGANPTRGRYKTQAQGVESIALLVEAGADINATNAQGQTALHAAAQKGWTDVVRALAEHGAALEIADASGVTPLQYASGDYEVGGRGAPPEAHPETAAALEELIAARVEG